MRRGLIFSMRTHPLAPSVPHTEIELDEVANLQKVLVVITGDPEGLGALAVGLDARGEVPAVDDPASGSPDNPLPHPLAECHLQLLSDPQRALQSRNGIELRKELTAAWVVTLERQDDDPQNEAWGESEHEHRH